MAATELLLAVVIVLLAAVAYYFGVLRAKKKDGFAPGATPYDLLHSQLDIIRGYHNDGYGQPPVYAQPGGLRALAASAAAERADQLQLQHSIDLLGAAPKEKFGPRRPREGLDSYHHVLVDKPGRRLARAEQEQWGSESPDDGSYGEFVSDLMIDPRMRENHQKWVEETKPWAGTALAVDDIQEAMEATTDFVGLRRPQAVVQNNPFQLTERDTATFAGNTTFRFNA